MLSGEWSVLELGVPSIVLAINRRVFSKLTKLEDSKNEFEVILNDYNIRSQGNYNNDEFTFISSDQTLKFAQSAIEISLNYIKYNGIKIKTFKLETYTKTDEFIDRSTGKVQKIGFGSSASAVVAIIASIIYYHGFNINSFEERMKLFKLSVIAHYFAQGKVGSGFDVAASTFGGALIYKRFDPEWLSKQLISHDIVHIVENDWPLLQIINISLPKELKLLVAFTGTSASTRKLVSQVMQYKEENPEDYYSLINEIKEVTENLKHALVSNNKLLVLELIKKNSELLHDLSDECSCDLEIRAHRIMNKIANTYDCSAKFSGAGGGDCSIGICFDEDKKNNILNDWKSNDFLPLDVSISNEGVLLEKNSKNNFYS